MIIVQLIGGLGNQLFQYAFGRSLAIKNNTELKLDINKFQIYKLHNFSLQNFNIDQNFATLKDIRKMTTVGRFHEYLNKKYLKNYFRFNAIKEDGLSFNPKYIKTTNKAYLEGYWQSEKYFMDVADTLRQDLIITTPLTGENLEFSKKIAATNSISLHIRRGDYVSDSNTNRVFGTCSMEYYLKAIEIITSQVTNPSFFIFTDDPSWVTENFKIAAPHLYVTHNNANTNYEDLRLMSLCKHNIIANSSFSWWGAWLNNNSDKLVIAPKNWFADPLREAQSGDIVPETWIRL
jgi:hypothetical protein